jgi:hypothetical protein
VNDANISWAAQIRTLGNSPEPSRMTPLKNTKAPVMQVLLDRFRHDRRYTATNFFNDPLPFDTRAALFVSTDTIMRRNPETYSETIEINRNELRTETAAGDQARAFRANTGRRLVEKAKQTAFLPQGKMKRVLQASVGSGDDVNNCWYCPEFRLKLAP